MTPERRIRREEEFENRGDEPLPMTPERRMGRARNRLRQALHNMDDNEFDSACNRAYYAAFEAAKAVLAALGVPEPKTHRGLNNQFHHHVVSTGLIDEDTGASLSKIEDKRLLADYVEDVIPEDKAREAVDMAKEFVEAIESKLALIIANKKERN